MASARQGSATMPAAPTPIIEWAGRPGRSIPARSRPALKQATPPSPMSFVVHCETTSGVLNPIAEIAAVVARRRPAIADRSHERLRRAAARCAARSPSDAVAASSNKCIEGVPGVGFVICRRDALEAAKGNAHSLSLDLHDQWHGDGEDRPVALHAADPGDRGLRARRCASMRPRAVSPAAARAIAATAGSWSTACARWVSRRCCPTRCRRRSSSPSACRPIRASCSRRSTTSCARTGYVIYPGKLTVADSLPHRLHRPPRRGRDEGRACRAIKTTMQEMGVKSGAAGTDERNPRSSPILSRRQHSSWD